MREQKVTANSFNTIPTPSQAHKDLQKALPLLPGHQFSLQNESLPNFRKSHAFDYCNTVSVFKKEAPGIGGSPLDGQLEDKIHTSVEIYPHGDGVSEQVPAWVAFDRKVLRFYAYFQEAVHERREETYRVRKVNIYFYLEDDTIHVSEPRSPNSGIPQGTLIRRHRIPNSEFSTSQHFIVSDINVGKEVTFYSRTFKIVGCDEFTRDFLTANNIQVPQKTPTPTDPYETVRQELISRLKPTRPYKPKTSLKKFLENDRRVLRFYCIWDDTNSVFGDVRHMVIHYFLSDDTIEIRETIPANSGRESSTLFLRRCRLPKKPLHVMINGGAGAGRGGGAAGGGGGGEEESNSFDFYSESDLIIGSVLHLHGRPFVICDCDEFTKTYYREAYGLENFDPVQFDESEPPVQEQISRSDLDFFSKQQEATSPSSLNPNILTHNSTKNKDDGMAGCVKVPKFDFKRMMLFDGVTLRFSAVLQSDKQLDRDRKFIIAVYPSDDTMSVFEPRQRNSGIIGGKFMEKGRILKPDNKVYYQTSDFKIGAQVTFHGHKFLLTGADDFAISFFKKHPNVFSM